MKAVSILHLSATEQAHSLMPNSTLNLYEGHNLAEELPETEEYFNDFRDFISKILES